MPSQQVLLSPGCQGLGASRTVVQSSAAMLLMKEYPLGQTYCSGLTWVLKSSLSTRSSCF